MGLFVLLQLFAISPNSLCGRSMNALTVRGMVKDYKKKLVEVPAEAEIQELPPSKHGHSLFLDEMLVDHVCNHMKGPERGR